MGPSERIVVALIGAIYLAMATQLGPPYFLADVIPDAPFTWEVIFVVAGATCLLCAIARTYWLRLLAGSLVMLAAGSRGVAVLIVAATDPTVSFLPALGWTLVFALQTVAWPVLAPPRRR